MTPGDLHNKVKDLNISNNFSFCLMWNSKRLNGIFNYGILPLRRSFVFIFKHAHFGLDNMRVKQRHTRSTCRFSIDAHVYASICGTRLYLNYLIKQFTMPRSRIRINIFYSWRPWRFRMPSDDIPLIVASISRIDISSKIKRQRVRTLCRVHEKNTSVRWKIFKKAVRENERL